MKALIRLFIDNKEVCAHEKLNRVQIEQLKIATDEWIQIRMEGGYSNFEICKKGVAFGIDNEFLYRFGSKKILITPMDIHNEVHIQFDFVGEGEEICYCGEVYCDGYCGTLSCGCIDVCRGRCGMNDYYQ